MIKKYFISNITILLVLNLLVKPLWILLIDRNVQLSVGHTEYGLYGALVGLSIIFNIIPDLGITNYNNKVLAASPALMEAQLPNMLVAKILLSILYGVVILISSMLLGYKGRALQLASLLALVQVLNSFLLFLRSNISAQHHFKTDSILSVLDKLLMLLICGVLLFSPWYRNDFVIEWFIYTQVISYLIAIALALWYISRTYMRIRFAHFSLSHMLRLCRLSIPYALLILLMAVYMRSDTLLLERMEGAGENSIYLEAYRILDASNMIAFLFAGILLPLFSRMLAQKLKIDVLVHTSANIMLGAAFSLVAFCGIYSVELMDWLYPGEGAELPVVFRWVISAFPAYCIMYIYSTLLTANGDIGLLIRIALFGCIFSLGVNVLLIPQLHALGAAITACLLQWILALICIWYSIRKFALDVRIMRLLRFASVLLVMLALNILLHYTGTGLWYAMLINLPVFLLLVYTIKLWDPANIISFLRQYKNIE